MSSMNRRAFKELVRTINSRVQHFNTAEIECLIREFEQLSISGTVANGLDRVMFKRMLHTDFGLTDEMIMDRVFRVFDKNKDYSVTVDEWIEGLCVFLRGNLDEKIKYCFSVYDLDSKQHISRNEMFSWLKDCLMRQSTEEDHDEGIRDVIEHTLKKMDHDHDGMVSFKDFNQAVREENLLLEAFGTCLPVPTSVEMYERRVFWEKL
ncbi:calaxin [Cololabis saira]|uniref:calaxin n=1 Tax=Cololabis saira TaxID=129043 RepID=UPI002AD41722|nr:calaxin [Cololabis saira]